MGNAQKRIATDDDIYQFYNRNWSKILYNGFDFKKEDVDNLELREHLGSDDGEFEKHLFDNSNDCSRENYIKVMKTGTNAEKAEVYKSYWINPEGMKRVELVPRSAEQGNPGIIKMLEGYSKKYQSEPQIEAWKLNSLPKQRTFTKEEAFEEIKQTLGIKFVSAFYIWHYYYKWWYNRDIQKYGILDGRQRIGYIYLEIDNKTHQQTIPIIPYGGYSKPINYLKTPNNYSLIHELVHTIQFCYNPFWKINRGFVEIPAIAVESAIRKKYNDEYDEIFIRKQVGVALADLTSNNPLQFNQNFEKYANVKDAYDICSRFWHYSKYDKKYYTYTLGLLLWQNNQNNLMSLLKMRDLVKP